MKKKLSKKRKVKKIKIMFKKKTIMRKLMVRVEKMSKK